MNQTRSAILAAGHVHFSRHGYDGTTVRAIAAEAGVDPALVHHYFRTKRALFDAALKLPDSASPRLITALTEPHPGEALVLAFVTAWETPGEVSAFAGLMRTAATEEATQQRLIELIATMLIAPAASAIRPSANLPKLRASLVAAQLGGIAWLRYVLKIEPVASASPQLLAKTIGPSIATTLGLV